MIDDSEEINDPKLSSTVTVSKYREFEASEEYKEAIISFIEERFTERYITPLQDRSTKHGFSMMAVNCLMIEALEAFWLGLIDTENPGAEVFTSFFNRNSNFKDFRGYGRTFYEDVRCGILHQAETKGGWRIIREGKLFEPSKKIINATEFQKQLKKSLELYCDSLREASWDEEKGLWEKLKFKMDAICKNCILDTTSVSRLISASPADIYSALLDANAVTTWMTPDGMTSTIHEFNTHEGGKFRISLTYDVPNGTGKTSADTDTYEGHFIKLVPKKRVVQTMTFETTDPQMKRKMTVTFVLTEMDNGTEVLAVHDNLPPGLSLDDNETSWRMALDKLAALVEANNSTSN